MPIDVAQARNFITAARGRVNSGQARDLTEAARQEVLTRFDTDSNGRLDLNESTNLTEIYASLQQLSLTGNPQERQDARNMIAALSLAMRGITPQPAPMNENDAVAILQRIVPNENIPRNNPQNSVWGATIARNSSGFRTWGGTTHRLSQRFLNSMVSMLNQGVNQNVSAYDRARANFNNAVNNQYGGPQWITTDEMLTMFHAASTITDSAQRQEYIRGIRDAQMELIRNLPENQRGAIAYAWELLRDGINFNGMGTEFRQAASEITDGILDQIGREFNILISSRGEVDPNLQIHFVSAQNQDFSALPLATPLGTGIPASSLSDLESAFRALDAELIVGSGHDQRNRSVNLGSGQNRVELRVNNGNVQLPASGQRLVVGNRTFNIQSGTLRQNSQNNNHELTLNLRHNGRNYTLRLTWDQSLNLQEPVLEEVGT